MRASTPQASYTSCLRIIPREGPREEEKEARIRYVRLYLLAEFLLPDERTFISQYSSAREHRAKNFPVSFATSFINSQLIQPTITNGIYTYTLPFPQPRKKRELRATVISVALSYDAPTLYASEENYRSVIVYFPPRLFIPRSFIYAARHSIPRTDRIFPSRRSGSLIITASAMLQFQPIRKFGRS